MFAFLAHDCLSAMYLSKIVCQLRLLESCKQHMVVVVRYAYGNMPVLSMAGCTFVHDRSSAIYLVVCMLFVYSTIPPFNPLYSVIHQPHAYLHMYGYKLYDVHLFIFLLHRLIVTYITYV